MDLLLLFNEVHDLAAFAKTAIITQIMVEGKLDDSAPAFVRSLLGEPPNDAEVASRGESLAILTALARDGRVSAAIALEQRALREHDAGDEDDELAKILQN